MIYSLAAGISVACLAYVLIDVFRAARQEARAFREMGRAATSPLFKIVRPIARLFAFLIGGSVANVEMAFGRSAQDSYLATPRIWAEKKLRAAAHPEGVTADEFLGMVVLGGLFFTIVGTAFNIRVKFNPIIIFFAAFGMYMPVLWLRGRLRKRQEDIRHGLPYALDLLTLSVESGLDFTQALIRIVRKLGNTALAVELGQMVRDIQLGRTRAQALRELGRRVEVSELNSIVSALIQADELGSSLGQILRIQSDQLRQRRSQAAEKLAMEAPVKLLLPLILFIFPTIFLIIFGPMALKFMK